MMLDATQNYKGLLTKERLFDWHAALFPTRRSGMMKITVAEWRKDETGPMQIVSGPMGKEKVHFQAPSADILDKEMNAETILNPRQHLMLNILLDDFFEKLTTSKWAKIARCSQDTALRDIQDLVNKRVLVKEPEGGRSTSYVLKT